MLFGSYQYAIDVKGRFNFPPKFREYFGETFTVTKWMDNSLVAFSQSEWENMVQKLREKGYGKARQAQLYLFTSAVTVVPDKQGRILLPQTLRDDAKISKDVSILGMGEHAEIWSTQIWQKRKKEIDKIDIVDLMQELEL